ncbi:MAG: copper-binding protein [Roseateles sp.]|uniref:copper-binding protein n=1 Tax=Roseateles sp. TaxID=1971397 RepID=UPI0040366A42
MNRITTHRPGLFAATLLTVALLSPAAWAAGSGAPPAQASAPTASAEMTDAEVRKVDRDTGRLTLKHADIKSLDMPAMTMVFQVRDKAMLDKLQPGTRIQFNAVSEGGKFVVTALKVLP